MQDAKNRLLNKPSKRFIGFLRTRFRTRVDPRAFMGVNGWNQFLKIAERPGGEADVGKVVVGGGSIVRGTATLNCDAPRSSGKNA